MSEVGTGHEAIAAIGQRFDEHLSAVPVLRQRAAAENVSAIRCLEDLVPLLFPHTVYKSYPASLVDNGRWAQMNRWLDSVSARRVDVDVTGVENVDDWLARLATAGHYVSQSSGTTGKSSFLNKSQADLEATAANHIALLTEKGIVPDNSWHTLGFGAAPANILARHMQGVLQRNFSRPDNLPAYPAPPPTESHHAYMSRLSRVQRALADGTASPDEVAAVKAEQASRQAEAEKVLSYYVDQVMARRSEKMLFGTMMSLAWRFVEELRARGVKPGDITGENAVYMAGGTKGVVLPPDHEAQICAMLNVPRERFVQLYSMQEINIAMPKCSAGRYHTRPDLVLLVLDEPGEKLAEVSDGHAEGRAAFFDLTVDARWGGTMSGDFIRAQLDGCPCGAAGPSISPEITRFANKVDGDKITCAGTMDAYVRGFIEE
jgi:hypothetical protein